MRATIAMALLFATGAAVAQTLSSTENFGQSLYLSNCAACHGANGAGIRPVFPALAGAPILKDKSALIRSVLFPRPNTAMASFCNLHAEELAAILSFVRQAWAPAAGNSVRPEEVLDVVRAHPGRTCATAELSRKPLPRQVLNFNLSWLAQTQLQALGQANQFDAIQPAFGALVQAEDKLYLVQSRSLAANELLGAAQPRHLPWSVRYLAPCAVSRLAAERGFAGWAVVPTSENPDPRFAGAYEISLLDEAETRRRFAEPAPGQVHFSVGELRRVCEGVLADRFFW